MAKIRRMAKGSAHTGRLPDGCILCEKGAKLVLLVTGICDRRCYYCPLSSEKKGKDVFFANERRASKIEDIIEEAELMDALGTGITGGDPLSEVDRTVACIKALKRRFGNSHQIHLYTSTTDSKRIKAVARAGLDEIRFHPPLGIWRMLTRSEFPKAIGLSKSLGMSTGMELPVVPGRGSDLVDAVSFADSSGLDFVNLNELEFSETNWRALRVHEFEPKDDISSGAKGSQELALDLLRLDADVPLHYCSASFKDGVQLRRRILRRARNVRKPHEVLTRDGTLVKGVIETNRPAKLSETLVRRFDIPKKLVWIDLEKKRLEVAPWILEEIAADLPYPSSVVEEYPTADRLEVERIPLRRR
ncbi:MAG TPA: radical SAM protein [Thermoplasmata archaeon]|nr:radical SAM protein [Thermoplasmata archaeon]